MKNQFLASYLLLAMFALTFQSCSDDNSLSDIEKAFISPPESVQTSIYWYWINDNISKEAVVKDLQAMKQVGINRAFIGNIGLFEHDYPYGDIKLLSDEWWEITHTALKTASELDIEIGIFNSPGWSQSGGPWVKPEQAMRYLASSETKVKGPQKLTLKLEQPTTDFQDVKVIAWPVAQNYRQNLMTLPGAQIKISSDKENKTMKAIMTFPEEVTARSLILKASADAYADCELFAKTTEGDKKLRTFKFDRTNLSISVGFDPLANVAVTFPEEKAKEFILEFKNIHNEAAFNNIELLSTVIVERYPEKSLAKMHPHPLPYWHDYLWEAQPNIDQLDKKGELATEIMTAPEKVVDVSQYMTADGTLTWDVPEGEWIIMRTGMAPTGVVNGPASKEGQGLEADKMSKEHIAAHFDAFLGEIIRRIPAEDRKTWKVIVQDSYETGGQNFTDDFLVEFAERYGYDPVPFLPVFKGHTIGSPDLSDRFLWDIRRLIADKVAYDYVGGLREVGHKHGLTTWLENYGHWGFPGEFLQYGGQSDEIGGEFWSEGDLGNIENRAASSCAHIYGKQKVSAESFTCALNAYSRYPSKMKKRGDWSFTEGINNTLLHVYIQQAHEDRYPGVDTWFGNEFNRKNTWFDHMDLFTTYLKRCNFMLQQGLNVADVAYFIGEDAPKMTGVRDPEIPIGHTYDYINGEVIVRDLAVKNGRLTLPHGTSYRVLVLPKLETMRPEVLQKIEKLVSEGAVILGPPPSKSPSMQNYPEADSRIKALTDKMWGDLSVKQRTYGKGTIFTDMTMQEVFDALKIVPDCKFADEDPMLYIHRTVSGKEIYFISNQSENKISIKPEFRVSGMIPELWDATTGEIRELPVFEQKGEITAVPIKLDVLESAFIVFRKKGTSTASKDVSNYPDPSNIIAITSPWTVRFESDEIKRGPSEEVVFTELQDWSKHSDSRIKYFSGSATYSTDATIDKINGKVYLELGQLSATAKISVNGEYAGGAWTPPYRLDITKQAKEGLNKIEVEVRNTWVNPLIGDYQLPETERKVYSQSNRATTDEQLQESGLLGPVTIRIE